MSNPRRHHYVPISYLQYFVIKNSNDQINVIDKNNDEPYVTNIKNVAVERDFYKSENPTTPYYWENYYAENIDSLIKPTFDKLIINLYIVLGQKHHSR